MLHPVADQCIRLACTTLRRDQIQTTKSAQRALTVGKFSVRRNAGYSLRSSVVRATDRTQGRSGNQRTESVRRTHTSSATRGPARGVGEAKPRPDNALKPTAARPSARNCRRRSSTPLMRRRRPQGRGTGYHAPTTAATRDVASSSDASERSRSCYSQAVWQPRELAPGPSYQSSVDIVSFSAH